MEWKRIVLHGSCARNKIENHWMDLLHLFSRGHTPNYSFKVITNDGCVHRPGGQTDIQSHRHCIFSSSESWGSQKIQNDYKFKMSYFDKRNKYVWNVIAPDRIGYESYHTKPIRMFDIRNENMFHIQNSFNQIIFQCLWMMFFPL